MRRDDVFKNVAFGGAWSERILGVEQRQKTLSELRQAVVDCVEEDLRERPALNDAVVGARSGIPKAQMLRDAWVKAINLELPVQRQRELKRIYDLIETAVGTSAKI